MTAGIHRAQREPAASVLLALGEAERDDEVHWSIASALGATADPRAVPLLIRLADHADPGVRFQVALSLPPVWSQDPAGSGVVALIRLTSDTDAEVRNWATFGLGNRLTEADSADIRAALWERTTDGHLDAREEGICGLARRRDPRAVSLVARLLAAEGGAHTAVFDAAAVLGAAELLPLLENFNPEDPGVQEALNECDPAARDRRDQFAWDMLCFLYRRQPGIDAYVYTPRYDTGVELQVTVGGTVLTWSVGALRDRADRDPELAATFVAADLHGLGAT